VDPHTITIKGSLLKNFTAHMPVFEEGHTIDAIFFQRSETVAMKSVIARGVG